MRLFQFKLLNPNLRSKIQAGFAIIVLIMLLVTFYSVFNFYRFNESIKSTLILSYNNLIYIDEMNQILDEQQYCLVTIFNEKMESQNKLFDSLTTRFQTIYEEAIMKEVILDTIKLHYDTLGMKFNYFVKNVEESRKVLFKKEKSDMPPSHMIYSGSKQNSNQLTLIIMNAVKEVKKLCSKINIYNQKIIRETIRNSKEITKSAAMWIVFILVAGIVISFIFITRFTDYIVKPIHDLTKTVQAISEGNFDEKIQVQEVDDEISNLAQEFNIMSEKLQIYERMNVNKILFEKRKSEIILENINEPVVVTDEFLNIVIANKQFKDVFSIGETEGLNLKFLFPKNFFFDRYANITKKNRTKSGEPYIILSEEEGKNKFFIPIYSFIHIPESDFAGLVIVFNDITKFQELDSMKSEFIAKVSHELKTPLTSLGMAVGLMEEGIVGDVTPKQQELLLSMKDDYKRLNKMVVEILELTKIESGSYTLIFEKIEMKNLLEHLVRDFKWRADENKIRLYYTIENNVSIIKGNFDYLLRALENLIANSLKFTHKGGEISIHVEKEGNEIIISIADTGIGIGQKQIDKIFDKFYQVDSNIQGSVGLGLSIVKEIIDLHHGEIRVKSQPGKGSEFTIRLPAE